MGLIHHFHPFSCSDPNIFPGISPGCSSPMSLGCGRWMGFSNAFPGWWFQIFFIFTPTWGNDPIWLIFKMGPFACHLQRIPERLCQVHWEDGPGMYGEVYVAGGRRQIVHSQHFQGVSLWYPQELGRQHWLKYCQCLGPCAGQLAFEV